MPLSPEITLELLQTQFVKAFNNTEALAQEMKISDPMSRETRIMCQVGEGVLLVLASDLTQLGQLLGKCVSVVCWLGADPLPQRRERDHTLVTMQK